MTENISNADLVLLYLVDPLTGELVAAEFDPWMDQKEKELIRETRFQVGVGIVGWVAQTHEAANITNASRHERFDHDAEHAWLRALVRGLAQRISGI